MVTPRQSDVLRDWEQRIRASPGRGFGITAQAVAAELGFDRPLPADLLSVEELLRTHGISSSPSMVALGVPRLNARVTLSFRTQLLHPSEEPRDIGGISLAPRSPEGVARARSADEPRDPAAVASAIAAEVRAAPMQKLSMRLDDITSRFGVSTPNHQDLEEIDQALRFQGVVPGNTLPFYGPSRLDFHVDLHWYQDAVGSRRRTTGEMLAMVAEHERLKPPITKRDEAARKASDKETQQILLLAVCFVLAMCLMAVGGMEGVVVLLLLGGAYAWGSLTMRR